MLKFLDSKQVIRNEFVNGLIEEIDRGKVTKEIKLELLNSGKAIYPELLLKLGDDRDENISTKARNILNEISVEKWNEVIDNTFCSSYIIEQITHQIFKNIHLIKYRNLLARILDHPSLNQQTVIFIAESSPSTFMKELGKRIESLSDKFPAIIPALERNPHLSSQLREFVLKKKGELEDFTSPESQEIYYEKQRTHRSGQISKTNEDEQLKYKKADYYSKDKGSKQIIVFDDDKYYKIEPIIPEIPLSSIKIDLEHTPLDIYGQLSKVISKCRALRKARKLSEITNESSNLLDGAIEIAKMIMLNDISESADTLNIIYQKMLMVDTRYDKLFLNIINVYQIKELLSSSLFNTLFNEMRWHNPEGLLDIWIKLLEEDTINSSIPNEVLSDVLYFFLFVIRKLEYRKIIQPIPALISLNLLNTISPKIYKGFMNMSIDVIANNVMNQVESIIAKHSLATTIDDNFHIVVPYQNTINNKIDLSELKDNIVDILFEFSASYLGGGIFSIPIKPGSSEIDNKYIFEEDEDNNESANFSAISEWDEISGDDTAEKARKMLQGIRLGARRSLAKKSTKKEFYYLLFDKSPLVIEALLDNPKLTEDDLLIIARRRSTPSNILETIYKNKNWARLYNIRLALANNPSTPVYIGLEIIPTLNMQDIVNLLRNVKIQLKVKEYAQKELEKYLDNLPTEYRRRMAEHAEPEILKLLLSKMEPEVIKSALLNPSLSWQDVWRLLNFSILSQDIINQIASDPRWINKIEITIAIIKQPATPKDLISKLLDTLDEIDVRIILRDKDLSTETRELCQNKILMMEFNRIKLPMLEE